MNKTIFTLLLVFNLHMVKAQFFASPMVTPSICAGRGNQLRLACSVSELRCNGNSMLAAPHSSQFNGSTGDNTLAVTTAVEQEANDQASLTVYPNPATDNISLHFQHYGAGQYNVTLYNIVGQVICSFDLAASNNEDITHQLNVSHYPGGIYFARCTFISDADGKQRSFVSRIEIIH